MDLKAYYRRIKELAESITESEVIVVSLATADGGRAGVMGEVVKYFAAKMIADGKARLASAEEARQYREGMKAARRAAEEAMAKQVQIRVISSAELRALRRPKG